MGMRKNILVKYCRSFYKYAKEYLGEKVVFIPYMKHVNLPQVQRML